MPEHAQPIVTVDVVILTLKEGALHVALARREQAPHAGTWTLPGGWVHTDEDEDALAAAQRILEAKAGLESPYLEQLQTFASRHRDNRGWSVSIAHYALVPFDAAGSGAVEWRAVDTIRTLPFDHAEILRTAVDRVRSKTAWSSLPVHLMPPTFTLSQLQRVYEQVLGTELDKRTFRRRIEELDLVEPAPGAKQAGGAHRPAQAYRVKRRFGRELALSGKLLA
ncbi:MAG TPA: NUDIX domain-containing protein [Steroidobacteraceae bacterium]|jgi:8-oxo-dGTP diphosphatase|nr:NUDIX domain-containing protein [Steroidobacteraceae bacterium]